MTTLVTRRCFSSSQDLLKAHLRRHLIFGSNTDVGKTVVSAGLVRASPDSHYIKPLQCGGSDQAFVETYAPQAHAQTIFRWETAASPHVACAKENSPKSDKEVLDALHSAMMEIDEGPTWLETAGGVLSPSSASPLNQLPKHASTQNSWGWTTQADLYQPLLGAAPVVLVGDGRLGGISATLSSLESLLIRGYDVAALILIETPYGNTSALREHVSRQLKLRSGAGRALFADQEKSIVSLPELPPESEPLHDWYNLSQVSETFSALNEHLEDSWTNRTQELETMRSDGRKVLWWPFTQHGNVQDDTKVTLIDSANGDNFHIVKDDGDGGLVRQTQFDACASWWTQGLGHGDSSMALAAAAAAGRYGHVIFPDNVHAPAVELAKKLVEGPGNGWASRVFFSDDGSTAMEVSIKMGLKTYQKWHNIENENDYDWIVAAQEDCYHGDTLGVMDVAEPSVFNEGQHPWYEPKGLFLATPTLGFHNGALCVTLPATGEVVSLDSVDAAMDVETRLGDELYSQYVDAIQQEWDACESTKVSSKPRKIGSVLIEPVLVGAGGMKFIDPLWQRALIDVARAKRVPVVFDEVASGLYRVGVQSCREIIKADPDIASYAKLLTGGLIPLSVTLASEDVFSTFLGDEKGQALLHGHSYTAHPIGCVSAIHALETYDAVLEGDGGIQNSFDVDHVRSLSLLPVVQQSFALGTVMAITIQPDEGEGSGYAAASRTTPMVRYLRDQGVFARPLGNVIYVMASPLTSKAECARLCSMVEETLLRFGRDLQDN
jgi:dethiobiotin synthetase/adenosylmethionine--8-amino-7-oxononanoate aminotransferase